MILLLVSGIIAALLAVVAELALASMTVAFGLDLTLWDPSLDGFAMPAFLPRIPSGRPLPLPFLFGIGFAAVELALLSVEHTDAFARPLPALGIGAIHILTAVAYGLLPSGTSRPRKMIVLIIGILAHAFYNLFLALI